MDIPSVSDLFSAADGDQTLHMLSQLFGPVPGIFDGGTSSPLSEMFMVFNMAVFTVAVVVVLYGVVSGIMHTAHSGQIFGGKTTIWYPIRIVYGLLGLIPVFSGWSFPQVIMMGLMSLGIGVANLTWETGARFMLSNIDHLVVANPSSAGRDDAIQAIMQAQMCALGHNELQLSEQEVSGKPAVLFSPLGDLRSVEPGGWFGLGFGGVSMSWGSQAAGYHQDDCGAVRIKSSDMMTSTIGLPHGSDATKPGYSEKDVEAAHSTALQDMASALLPLSKALYHDGQVPSKADLAAIRIGYMKTMADALSGAVQESESGFGEYMNDGVGRSWLYAGAIFAKIVDVNREIMTAAKIPIEVMPPRYEDVPPGVLGPASGGKEGLAKFEGLKAKIGENLSAKKFDLTSFISNSMGTDLVKSTMDAITWGQGDTLLGVINMGYTILDAAWGSYVAGMLLTGGVEVVAGTKAVGTGPGVPTATIGMALLSFASLIAPLILVGIICAFFIPFLPCILWFGGVLSYFIICIEAVCGAPLWMLAHLESEGDGFGQRAAHGLLFCLNVLFRPVLMTIGLVSGWLMANMMGEFLKYLLSILYGSSSYGFSGIASIFTFIASICVMASLMLTTVSKSFGLIHHIPNEVLAWVGGHIKPIGGGEDDSAKHFIAGGMGAYSNAAREGMGKSSGKARERVKTSENARQSDNQPSV